MPPKKSKSNGDKPVTTAQRLASIIKSSRDIMRKDKGLNGDTDRLPMLTWMMFLKFLDDKEHSREEDAILEGKTFQPIIEYPYRWRDWASPDDGLTGDELLAFINNDEVPHPMGEMDDKGKPVRVAGLFKYLRTLVDHPDIPQRSVIRNVFRDTLNRMINGYLIRDVLNKLDEIHFESSDEIDTLGALYESMLKEMRDAAGDSGEFYTPRPVVQFIVNVMNPQLGEVVFDPACGTGGFLVEAYQYLAKQVDSVEDRRILQNESIRGGEAKSLPYLLCQMNLLLHGMEAPDIRYGNSLARPLREIGDAERVDIILTNPPFGGEEEAGIKDNFPADKQTAETALLFLQLIMRQLGRGERAGRAAVVVPNGTLSATGVAARIKADLLNEYNLHTIVRLPNGVFEPYTKIPSNILFFERVGRTTDIWYYELPLPEGRKNYTKTKPIRFEEFADCMAWWNNRQEDDHAWKVQAEDILQYDDDGQVVSVDLDINNPNSFEALQHLPPEDLVASIMAKEVRIQEIMQEIRDMIGGTDG
jgi:type I restriction enzyme M protein